VKLKLAGPLPDQALPTEAAYRQALAHLAQRRPDLLALKAGYESQNQALREAILAQFPSLSVGLSRSVDNTGVFSTGLSITLSLPFLNGNRGQIAIARATRAQLHADYQARLDAAYGSLDELWQEIHLLHAQADALKAHLPALRKLTARARKAYSAGNLDALTYFTLQTTAISKESEAIGLEESLAEAWIALETLLGRPLPNAGQSSKTSSDSSPLVPSGERVGVRGNSSAPPCGATPHPNLLPQGEKEREKTRDTQCDN
jgi:outer membrane protein TolC